MLGAFMVALGLVMAGPGDDPAPVRADRAAYEAARKAAGHDSAAQVRLALWCEAHGMTKERMQHLAAAVLQDPGNTLARGLMGLVARDGKWERPDDVSREVEEDPRRKALLDEYYTRRARTPDRADDQWKLASWCDQNGLKEQAIAHYHAVLRLDPKREAAWRHLGFRKQGQGWLKPELQEAARREAEEQTRANKQWKPILERYRVGLASRIKTRREEAEAGLLAITDPRAVPMIWAVFVPKGAEGQKTAVRVLGQVDAPGSARALAMLALSSANAEVRGLATQVLRQRDPRDFAPFLVALIRSPIKYQVKKVGGPGSAGELDIQDGTSNRKRLYSPPPAPNFAMGPNDWLTTDASGMPVITRYLGMGQMPLMSMNTNQNSVALGDLGMTLYTPAQTAQVASNLTRAGLPAAASQQLAANFAQSNNALITISGDPSRPIWASGLVVESMQIPIGQMMMQSQIAAQTAEAQLEGDARSIDAYNAPILATNRRARQVLSETIGNDLGDDRSAWTKWLVDLFGLAYTPMQTSDDQPTVIEQVPLAYQPAPITPVIVNQVESVSLVHHSCFAAGTRVRTLDGQRPIESLRVGDLVLTENPRSGELKYEAIVTVYHNPPNATYRVNLSGGQSIVATGIHRLWKAGKGWTMTRELRAGDVLRTLGGIVTVASVEADQTQPVYNLKVAEGESYFVGERGVLAHDNSPINPVPEPFDAVTAPTAAATTSSAAPPRPTHSMLGR